MCNEAINNLTVGFLKDAELYRVITDVEYMPELRALNFKTAGYCVGMECAKAVYGDVKSDSVQYVIGNNTKVIDGDVMRGLAARYMYKDIMDASNLGYLYYNRSLGVKNIDDSITNLAQDNVKRYGVGNGVKSLSNLMRNFTDFIPVGFEWSIYTPLYMQSSYFVEKLKTGTVLGLDWIKVDNLTTDGHSIQDLHSVTYYTTKKRLYQVFGEKFDYYNYRFINEVMASLYLGSKLFLNSEFIATKANNEFITPIQYEALTDKDRNQYNVVQDEKSKMYAAMKLVATYWKTMRHDKSNESRALVEKLSTLTLKDIECDVETEKDNSYLLFNYVI